MTVFTTILLIGAFSVLIGTPGNILARPTTLQEASPHEVWNSCGTACETTCQNPTNAGVACIAVCREGYFCKAGYIRDTPGGNCVLPSECPPRA